MTFAMMRRSRRVRSIGDDPESSRSAQTAADPFSGANQIVGGLKIILVKPGHEQEFETLFAQLREIMREHEPDCLLYSLLKSRTNPRAYIVHEQYRDQAALTAHESSPHGAIFFPKIRAILESITVEYFDGIVV